MAINTMNVGVTNKGTPQTLFGGNLAASVAEANATVIDMQGYTGGALECQRNSGAGTWSIQLYAHESANNGTFIIPKVNSIVDAAGNGAFSSVDFPALATSANNSVIHYVDGIKSRYIKFVPTLSSTANFAFTFTPSK